MKKLIFLFCLSFHFVNAQTPFEFWGVTNDGGDGNGTIFRMDQAGTYQATDLFRPTSANGQSSIIEHPNGLFYGISVQGGAYNVGVLYQFDPADSSYLKLKDLDDSTGYSVYKHLTLASDGNIYGVATMAGLMSSSSNGTIFKYNVASNVFSTVHTFGPGVLVAPWNPDLPLHEVAGTLYSFGNGDSGSLIYGYEISTGTYNVKQNGIPGGSLDNWICGSNGKLYSVSGNDIVEYIPSSNSVNILSPVNNTLINYNRYAIAVDSAGIVGYTNTGGAMGFGVI
ncbi:MAG: hypothetical protein M3R27_02820, partial [Bacteroidota bacterium]|nr:hypothetical protein [Bacteroidota bacterium]